jgi:hypothetical protein
MCLKKQKKPVSASLLLFILIGVMGVGCSSKTNKDQPMAVLDQNKNGIRDYIEPEIIRIANGSEMERLVLEQYARAIDGGIDHVDDSKVIQKQGEKAFKASGCSLALKSNDANDDELIAIMNDTQEHSRVYFRITSAFIDYLNQHINEDPSIKDCEFDASKYVGKK